MAVCLADGTDVIAILSGLLLPLTLWLCWWQNWPMWLAGAVLLPLAWQRRNLLGWLGPCAAAMGALALICRSVWSLLFYPVLVNLAFLIVFAVSLRREQSIIETFARRLDPDLPPEGVRYTRRVTKAWCVFFIVNGSIALWTTGQSPEIWALYNGLIAYLLMGLMFGGEWLTRRRFLQHHPRRS